LTIPSEESDKLGFGIVPGYQNLNLSQFVFGDSDEMHLQTFCPYRDANDSQTRPWEGFQTLLTRLGSTDLASKQMTQVHDRCQHLETESEAMRRGEVFRYIDPVGANIALAAYCAAQAEGIYSMVMLRTTLRSDEQLRKEKKIVQRATLARGPTVRSRD